MLFRMRLVYICLCDFLHHEIRVNLDFFAQLAARDTPLSRDGEHADGRLGVDERVDALSDVGESELVCCLNIHVSDTAGGMCLCGSVNSLGRLVFGR